MILLSELTLTLRGPGFDTIRGLGFNNIRGHGFDTIRYLAVILLGDMVFIL